MDAGEKIQELLCDVRGLPALLMATIRDLARLTLLPRDNSDMVSPSVGVIAVGLGFSSLIC